jgi:membrane protein DedA with SNARE-associated domain
VRCFDGFRPIAGRESALLGAAVSEGLSALLHFSEHDYSWLAQFLSLWVLPFAHEDLAIILGGYIVVNKVMPVGLVAAIIYCGIVASDFALYGIGAGARRLPWLNRLAVNERVDSFSDMLKRNLFGLVALCRVVPGIVFIAFIACGWSRVSLARFTLASLVVSALYLPLMLYLVVFFGDALDDHAGLWTWPFLLSVLVAIGFVRRQVFALQKAFDPPHGKPSVSAVFNGHRGMPALVGLARNVAWAERIPPALFYLPLALSWIVFGLRYRSLTLPTAVNPRIPTGGMWGESKSDCLLDVAASERQWVADFIVVRRSAEPQTVYADVELARQALDAAGLAFPLVAKPDIGWQGYGVRRINDLPALHDYLRDFPAGEKLLLQRFVPHAGEAVLLYARLPGAPNGRILSLAFRYYPHVIGDGRRCLRDLIRKDVRARRKARLHLGYDPTHQGLAQDDLDRAPARGEVIQIALIGSARAGTLHRDARRFITPELEARLDAIARSMTEFHYGWFDLRFASAEDLMRGQNFSIVEINGIGGELPGARDPLLSAMEVYRRIVDRQRILFLIGERNRARGVKPMGCADLVKHLLRRTQLVRRYPASA